MVLFPIIHIFIAAVLLLLLILIMLLLVNPVTTMNIILIFLIDDLVVILLNHALLLAAARGENGGVALDPPLEKTCGGRAGSLGAPANVLRGGRQRLHQNLRRILVTQAASATALFRLHRELTGHHNNLFVAGRWIRCFAVAGL